MNREKKRLDVVSVSLNRQKKENKMEGDHRAVHESRVTTIINCTKNSSFSRHKKKETLTYLPEEKAED
ncbi:MAG: hypothetical protein ACI90V_006561 [Bacillariaceae sp.]|jgi:hypothetical protein